jgi:hypothetical protein
MAEPADSEEVARLKSRIKDADAQAVLRVQLRKILEADSSLAAEIAKILEAAGPQTSFHAEVDGSGAVAQGMGNVVAGKEGIAVGRDVRISK